MAIDPTDLSATADLTFADEFDALDLWKGGKDTGWATDVWYDKLHGKGYSYADNGEQEWYINVNYGPTSKIRPWKVSDGILTITAAPTDAATKALLGGYDYTSGSLNTYHSFSQLYGYFEMRAKLPAGQGFWPAFWLLPEDGSWPPELDVMEVLGKDMTTLYLTAHSGASGHHTQKGTSATVADMSKGFHTYGVDWEADRITWYFDEHKIASVKTPSDMHKAMYMIVNLAVGGNWGGMVDGTTPFPGTLKVDYIRAYQSLPESDLTLKADGTAHQVLKGGTGDDLFKAGGGDAVVMTGFAGDDTFFFGKVPTHPGHITDFAPGEDKIDVSALLKQAQYHDTHPFADGYLSLQLTAKGDTWLRFDDDGASGPHKSVLVTRLDGLSPSDIHKADFILTHTAAHPAHVPSTAAPDDAATPSPDYSYSLLERAIAAASHMPVDFLFG